MARPSNLLSTQLLPTDGSPYKIPLLYSAPDIPLHALTCYLNGVSVNDTALLLSSNPKLGYRGMFRSVAF
jgi:hypothetical protein